MHGDRHLRLWQGHLYRLHASADVFLCRAGDCSKLRSLQTSRSYANGRPVSAKTYKSPTDRPTVPSQNYPGRFRRDTYLLRQYKICTEAKRPVHHPESRPQKVAEDAKWEADQEKQRREQTIANATGLRDFAAVSAAVPVRLMKRDLLFILEKLVGVLDENRLEMLARQHGIRQKRDDGGVSKTLAAYIRRADEGTLSRLLVETTILLAASRANAATVLRDAATAYKVDTDAITLNVKQEFAAREKAKRAAQPAAKTTKKAA